MKRAGKRTRLADVAKMAGVSEATASVVLNNRVGTNTRVSEETQIRVLDVARSLGYVANPLARHLAGGQNKILAIFTFEAVFPIDRHDFYYPFLIGIEEEAARCGYNLLLVTSATASAEKRRIYEHGINQLQLAAGALLLGDEDPDEVERLLEDGYPFVFIGRRDSRDDNISYAAADYVTATTELVNHLFALGHENIVYMQPTDERVSSRDRRRGYELAYRQRGLTPDADLNVMAQSASFSADHMRQLLAQGVTAFVTENDGLATQVLDIADQLGLACPHDFSLAVLGDPLTKHETSRDWTSFSIPRREMGREAVRLLLESLTDPDDHRQPRRITLACTFLPGSTTAAPRS